MGAIACGMTRVTDETMLIAATTLAALVTQEDLDVGCVYPPLSMIRKVSLKIAVAVAEYAYKMGFTTVAKPANLEKHCESLMYNP